MDSRRVWFVVETKEEFDRLSLKYPGRILLCDRTFIMDTHAKKYISDTTLLHEIRSFDTSVPTSRPRTWQVYVSNLPCVCKHCIIDPDYTLCTFAVWRNTRLANMQIACVSPSEAESWVGHKISELVAGQRKSGTIVQFKRDSTKWLVRFGDESTKEYDYIGICKARDQFIARNSLS